MKETRMKYEERVSRLLGSLDVIEAPENFEGIVRSRIADRRTSDRRTSDPLNRPVLWLALKFSAPLLLLVLIGAFLVLSDNNSLNIASVPPVETPALTASGREFDEPSNSVVAGSQDALPQRQPNRNVETERSEPLSQNKALEQDDTTIFPPGVDPRKALGDNRRQPPGNRTISPVSILSFIGISSGCSPASCSVRAVAPSSTAEKSGIRIGDLIEAIDDRPIDSTHLYSGSLSVKSLRIVRDGKRITVPLRVR